MDFGVLSATLNLFINQAAAGAGVAIAYAQNWLFWLTLIELVVVALVTADSRGTSFRKSRGWPGTNCRVPRIQLYLRRSASPRPGLALRIPQFGLGFSLVAAAQS